MNTIQIILLTVSLTYAGIFCQAQNTADSVKVTYKNKTVTLQPQGDESFTTIKFKDTSSKKNIVVKVAVLNADKSIENRIEDKLDSSSKKVYDMIKSKDYDKKRKHFIETSFLPTFDIGFASTINEIENSNTFTPKLIKSANIGIGIVRQNMNLINGQFLLSYALNLNNYYLKYSNKQNVQYIDNQGHIDEYKDTINSFSKNRLDVRFLSVPILLEYHTKNNDFNIAAGVEIGFNGNSRQVLKGSNEGKDFEQKREVELKMNPVQINTVLRIGFDNFAIFGKYSLTELYKNSAYLNDQNTNQHLFSFGVCVFGI